MLRTVPGRHSPPLQPRKAALSPHASLLWPYRALTEAPSRHQTPREAAQVREELLADADNFKQRKPVTEGMKTEQPNKEKNRRSGSAMGSVHFIRGQGLGEAHRLGGRDWTGQ